MPWLVLKFWHRIRTIPVSINIKIIFKDLVGQCDSLRVLLYVFSYWIWNKHLPQLWQGSIWHYKVVEGKDCFFLLFSWTKSVHSLLKNIKILTFTTCQTEISDLNILNSHQNACNNNNFLNFFVIVSTISNEQYLLLEYLNSYMLERKCDTVPFPWEPCCELIWTVTCLSCQELLVFL